MNMVYKVVTHSTIAVNDAAYWINCELPRQMIDQFPSYEVRSHRIRQALEQHQQRGSIKTSIDGSYYIRGDKPYRQQQLIELDKNRAHRSPGKSRREDYFNQPASTR